MLVHGFGDDYGMPWWKYTENQLDAYDCSVDPVEMDGFLRTVDDPERYAANVEKTVDDSYDTNIVLAHSMGGMVARHAIEDYGLDDTVDTLFTVGSPHNGTYAAVPVSKLGSDGAKAMKPSENGTLEAEDLADDVEYVNIVGENDLLVRKHDGYLPEADNVENMTVGTDICETVTNGITAVMDTGCGIVEDALRDTQDLLEGKYTPFISDDSDTSAQPRITDLRILGYRAKRLSNEIGPDPDDLLSGHIGMLYSDELWDGIAEYLEPQD